MAQSLDQQAATTAQNELTPQQQAIQDQQSQLAAQQAAEQQSVLGFSQAAANMARPIAPYVQGVYNTAANEQDAFGKGFSDAFRSAMQGTASNVNDFLAKQGAPPGQNVVGDNGAADVMYMLGGYIPGTTMAREGAGWASAAAQYPSTLMGLGQQQLIQVNQNYAQLQKQYADQLTSLRQQYPQLYQQALSDLKNQALQQAQLAENKRQFNVTNARQAAEFKAEFGVSLTKAKASLTKAQQQRVSPTLSAAAHHYVDVNGHPIRTRDGQLVPYKPYIKPNAATGSSRNAQFEKYRTSAFKDAAVYAKPGKPRINSTGSLVSGGVSRAAARQKLMVKYAAPLRSIGVSNATIKQMINRALQAAYG